MAKSFQHEVPRSRVNITLDLETGGAKKKLELPLKLLAVGDYSNGQGTGRVAERERIKIDKHNFESVLGDLKPRVRYLVDNCLRDDGSEMQVDLAFDGMRAFSPEQVAKKVPEINDMLAMRNLLKDLKSNLLDNGKFRRELERIIQTEPELGALMEELRRVAPISDESARSGQADGGTDEQTPDQAR